MGGVVIFSLGFRWGQKNLALFAIVQRFKIPIYFQRFGLSRIREDGVW